MVSEQIPTVVSTFMAEVDQCEQESKSIPPSWQAEVSEAVALKRREDYVSSAKIYLKLTRESGVAYTGLIRALYKTVASAGYLAEALRLAVAGKAIYDRSPEPLSAEQGLLSAFESDIGELLSSAKSGAQLEPYLSRISGSPIYRMPREYSEMLGELNQAELGLDAGLLMDIRHRWERRELENPGMVVVRAAADVRSMLELGEIAHEQGDRQEAIRLYTQALGDGIAAVGLRGSTMTRLGGFLEESGDFGQAARWYAEAAETGDVLGMHFLAGELVRQGDFDRAIQWYRSALDSGYPDAELDALGMAALGRAHAMRGDAEQAIVWYGKALDTECLDSAARLDVQRKMGVAYQSCGNHHQAIRFFREAAEAGDDSAMVSLGLALNEQGNTHEAIHWHTKAAEAGNLRGMTSLGLLLQERGLLRLSVQDSEQARYWLGKAAEGGEPAAIELLAQAAANRRQLGLADPIEPSGARSQPAKGGCYIATAVYGSYDAPQVRTLRRYRDETLNTSVGGRALVRAYYAVSPSMARHLERTTKLNKLARRALDSVVTRLEADADPGLQPRDP